jgi:hypothetical protein
VEYQDVVKAALMANAHSFISALPKVIYNVQNTGNKVKTVKIYFI